MSVNNNENQFNNLPPEMFLHIMSFLKNEPEALDNFRLVDKYTHQVASEIVNKDSFKQARSKANSDNLKTKAIEIEKDKNCFVKFVNGKPEIFYMDQLSIFAKLRFKWELYSGNYLKNLKMDIFKYFNNEKNKIDNTIASNINHIKDLSEQHKQLKEKYNFVNKVLPHIYKKVESKKLFLLNSIKKKNESKSVDPSQQTKFEIPMPRKKFDCAVGCIINSDLSIHAEIIEDGLKISVKQHGSQLADTFTLQRIWKTKEGYVYKGDDTIAKMSEKEVNENYRKPFLAVTDFVPADNCHYTEYTESLIRSLNVAMALFNVEPETELEIRINIPGSKVRYNTNELKQAGIKFWNEDCTRFYIVKDENAPAGQSKFHAINSECARVPAKILDSSWEKSYANVLLNQFYSLPKLHSHNVQDDPSGMISPTWPFKCAL